MSAIARSNTMRHFDEYLKPTFCPPEFNDSFDDEDDLDELASYNCPLPGVADNRDKAIYKGHLLLTLDEMRTVFQPTFNAITKLVQEQILMAEQKTKKPVTVGNQLPPCRRCRWHKEVSLKAVINRVFYLWEALVHHNIYTNISAQY